METLKTIGIIYLVIGVFFAGIQLNSFLDRFGRLGLLLIVLYPAWWIFDFAIQMSPKMEYVLLRPFHWTCTIIWFRLKFTDFYDDMGEDGIANVRYYIAQSKGANWVFRTLFVYFAKQIIEHNQNPKNIEKWKSKQILKS